MKKLKIYLDTSVINFLFADDVPEFMKVTEEFFDNFVKPKYYDVYISEIVFLEIGKTPDEVHKERLLQVIKRYELKELTNDKIDEVKYLANLYIVEKVIPLRKIEDALHIAYAVVNEVDILLSWNFKHLANIKKEKLVQLLNQKYGYNYPFRILTPLEVDYEE